MYVDGYGLVKGSIANFARPRRRNIAVRYCERGFAEREDEMAQKLA